MISLLISVMLFFSSCTISKEKEHNFLPAGDTCRSMDDAEKLKNQKAVIIGRLQQYTPTSSGKGSGHMFWQWEIKLPGGGEIPVVSKDKSGIRQILFDGYESRNVIINGTVYYGIVIGDSNPEHQSATGYRIDAEDIEVYETVKPPADTSWVYADIQAYPEKDMIIAGKIIEYVPPGDNSKLGDEKIWDYELLTQDGFKVPMRKDQSLNIEKFKDKDVFINGYIKYGIIFGEPKTANMQGYRIDAFDITANETGYGNTLIEGKIRLDLSEFNDEGFRVHNNGEQSSTSYEFCIPAGDSFLNEVMAIDPTAGALKSSKGRSGCSDIEWLVIGSTRQKNFKDVIRKLAELTYIRKITETFWE